MAVRVTDNAEEHRFEIRVDDDLAGFAVYRARPSLIAFIHTEIDDRFEGQGLGSQLIRAALDSTRERGLAGGGRVGLRGGAAGGRCGGHACLRSALEEWPMETNVLTGSQIRIG